MGWKDLLKNPVVIVPYDEQWPKHFESEQIRLQPILSGINFRIEHAGSTAVPGLGAKPIIDIMLGVDQLSQIEKRIPAFEKIGYLYVPEIEAMIPGDRFFYRQDTSGMVSHHLHGVELSSNFWRDHLLFRDYLRAHPEVAEQYFQLKRKSAEQFRDNRSAYTESKSEFIAAVLTEAQKTLK